MEGAGISSKAFQGSETETRNLLEERTKTVFQRGVIYLPSRQINDFLPIWVLIFDLLATSLIRYCLKRRSANNIEREERGHHLVFEPRKGM